MSSCRPLVEQLPGAGIDVGDVPGEQDRAGATGGGSDVLEPGRIIRLSRGAVPRLLARRRRCTRLAPRERVGPAGSVGPIDRLNGHHPLHG